MVHLNIKCYLPSQCLHLTRSFYCLFFFSIHRKQSSPQFIGRSINTEFDRLLKYQQSPHFVHALSSHRKQRFILPHIQICIHSCLQTTSKIRSNNRKASDCRRPFTASSSSNLSSLYIFFYFPVQMIFHTKFCPISIISHRKR